MLFSLLIGGFSVSTLSGYTTEETRLRGETQDFRVTFQCGERERRSGVCVVLTVFVANETKSAAKVTLLQGNGEGDGAELPMGHFEDHRTPPGWRLGHPSNYIIQDA